MYTPFFQLVRFSLKLSWLITNAVLLVYVGLISETNFNLLLHHWIALYAYGEMDHKKEHGLLTAEWGNL